jgi:hypothetical protein
MDIPANLALFLTERTGSCLKTWSGKLTATEQRALFGKFLGKGKIWIDGANETIEHHVKVCFGADTECTFSCAWRDLRAQPATPSQSAFLAALGPCGR